MLDHAPYFFNLAYIFITWLTVTHGKVWVIREFVEIYLNSASKNTSETDIFPLGTKSLLTSVISTSGTVNNSCNWISHYTRFDFLEDLFGYYVTRYAPVCWRDIRSSNDVRDIVSSDTELYCQGSPRETTAFRRTWHPWYHRHQEGHVAPVWGQGLTQSQPKLQAFVLRTDRVQT